MPYNKYLKCLKYKVLRVKKSKNGFLLTKTERSFSNSYFRNLKTTSFCLAAKIKRPLEKFERNSKCQIKSFVLLGTLYK